METIETRYEMLQKALLTLERGLEISDTTKAGDLHDIIRDGIIQRFEYSIDTFWKFFKMYLETNTGVVVNPPSPRVVLRLLSINQLATQEECDVLDDCVSDRNLTSHTYNEKLANEIYGHIPLYYVTMQTIVERLK